MALPINTEATAIGGTGTGGARTGYGPALTLLASLFFMWGFITVINNTLLPHLRSVFELDYTQTTLIESVWFIAYFVASIPAAKLIERVGYQRALVAGLGIMALQFLCAPYMALLALRDNNPQAADGHGPQVPAVA